MLCIAFIYVIIITLDHISPQAATTPQSLHPPTHLHSLPLSPLRYQEHHLLKLYCFDLITVFLLFLLTNAKQFRLV